MSQKRSDSIGSFSFAQKSPRFGSPLPFVPPESDGIKKIELKHNKGKRRRSNSVPEKTEKKALYIKQEPKSFDEDPISNTPPTQEDKGSGGDVDGDIEMNVDIAELKKLESELTNDVKRVADKMKEFDAKIKAVAKKRIEIRVKRIKSFGLHSTDLNKNVAIMSETLGDMQEYLSKFPFNK